MQNSQSQQPCQRRVYTSGLQNPTAPQRQAALFGNTAVHASFGDVELAQMTLRAAIQEGLDFEQALQDPELPGGILRYVAWCCFFFQIGISATTYLPVCYPPIHRFPPPEIVTSQQVG